MLGAAGFAVAGAVGSIVSQGVGIAVGAQDKFSWSGVAMGALATVAGGAATSIVGKVAEGGAQFGNVVARAAVGNVITPGVAVAVGLQDHFSWAGVAAAAVGAGVSYGVSQAVGRKRLATTVVQSER